MKSMIAILTGLMLLSGCGSSGGNGTTSQPPIANDPWAPIIEALDNDAVTDLALIVGNAAGEQFRYQKGSFDVTASYNIASASKWLTSATILTLVEQGIMDLADQPQDYLTYWTDEPSDPRSAITLAQLLSFTAGFQRSPAEGGCIGEETVSLADCVAEWYAIGVDATPGTTFHYGPVHMQVAAAMAEVATGFTLISQTLSKRPIMATEERHAKEKKSLDGV